MYLSLLALVIAALALVAVSVRLGPQHRSPEAGERILILDTGREEWPPGFEALSGARSARSMQAFVTGLHKDTDVVVLGPGVVRSLLDDEFAGVANRGIAIIAIETPLSDLWRVSGALSVLRSVDPSFADEEVQHASCAGCSRFYSYTWHSCPSDTQQQGGSGQGQLDHNRFETVLTETLALGRQCPR